MKRPLFEIWKEKPGRFDNLCWCVQMVNYVGYFLSREQAERFVAATKKAREQDAKKIK